MLRSSTQLVKNHGDDLCLEYLWNWDEYGSLENRLKAMETNAEARGKFVSRAKVLAAVPNISQPRRVYEDRPETGGAAKELSTMKNRVLEEWFSGMATRNLSHFCTIDNLVYMLSLFSLLRLIHVIVLHER